MEQSNPTKQWWLLVVRGLIYTLIGASLLFIIHSFTSQTVLFLGSLLVAAGACGCAYAFFTLRADRNYFWELIRSLFDVGFGIALLVFSRGEVDHIIGLLGFWAMLYAFLQAVQAIYIFLLSGVKQPRNIFGSVLHLFTVLVAGGLSYTLNVSNYGDIPFTLLGLFIIVLGIIIIVLAIQQRSTLLINKPA